MIASALFKLLMFLMLIIILVSLAAGLSFLAIDKGKSKWTIYSLTTRVALSISLFLLLLLDYATGLIKPNRLFPVLTDTSQP